MNFAIKVLHVTDRRAETAVQSSDFSGNIGIDSYQKLLNDLVEIQAARARVNHERAKIILDKAKAFFSDRLGNLPCNYYTAIKKQKWKSI